MKHPNKKHKLKHTTKTKLRSRIYLIKGKIIEKKIPCNMSTKSKIKAIKYKSGIICIYKINCKNAVLLQTVDKRINRTIKATVNKSVIYKAI